MKVVTFGELMVRLQPFNYERFVQANSLEFTFGGGEANVAVSLAPFGLFINSLYFKTWNFDRFIVCIKCNHNKKCSVYRMS